MEATAMIIDWRLLIPLRHSGRQSAYSGAIEKRTKQLTILIFFSILK
jgi:hypothetical protein